MSEQVVTQEQVASPDNATDNATYLRDNPEVTEKLAKIAREEMFKLFGEEAIEHLRNAKAAIDRRDAAAQAYAAAAADRNTPKPKLDFEQQAEVVKAGLMHQIGRPYKVDETLDADGLITQSLTSLTDAAGAYTVPPEVATEIEKKAAEPIVVWPLCTIKPTTRDQVTKPAITTYITPSEGTSAEGENATTATEVTVTEPVFTELTWNLYIKDARVPIHLTLLDESAVDLLQEIIDLAADGFAIKRETNVLNGTGAANKLCKGLLDSGTGITTVAVSAAPTVANILDLVGEVPKRYRMKATAIMGSDTLMSVIAQLAQNVRAIEYMLKVLPDMDDSEHVIEGKILVGDFKRYVIYQSANMKVVSSTDAKRLTLEVVMYEKYDGQPTITDAFRIGTSVAYG